MVTLPPNESQTRATLIDTQLAHAGWSSNRRTLIEEYALHVKEADPPYGSDQFVDYVLLSSNNEPLAIVEAKKSFRDALAGKRQAADYADLIVERFGFDPFIFLTNGNEIQFWDRVNYPPRIISGFYTRDDLERLLHQRKFALPPAEMEINAGIAGRDYQNEAIRRITEGIQQAKRSFLLVMATGTGKTRTAIALVDLLLKAKRVQRILFLADRRELVRQAMSEFKTHLPNESLARIESGQTSGARIQFATYPSMMQVYSRLSVGYYDLIVADESHRSIYQRYKAILDHFDAIRIGLTATPTDYIDHNTFELFDCQDGIPSYHYSYSQAVDDQHLVNYRVLDAQTTFQIKGIQGDALPEKLQQMALDQGVPIEELNFEGSDIEKNVINQGTNDAIVREFMDQCRKDTLGLPHKSIFFAMSHAHSKRLYQSFNRLYPEWQQQGLAEIIDSHMERADAVLDDFKFKNMPRVAISIDMLDTGIDVPAIQNLVFAKPVYSQVKFWQMIGRGTRLWNDRNSGEVKKDFLIIDHWKNFAYFKLNPEGEITQSNEPLPVRLFRLRLEKWQLLVAQKADVIEVITDLQQMLAGLPQQSINVQPHWDEICGYIAQWPDPNQQVIDHLSTTIAPLLRLSPGTGMDELQFNIWGEQLAIAWLKGDEHLQNKARERIEDAVAAFDEWKKAAKKATADFNRACRSAYDFFEPEDGPALPLWKTCVQNCHANAIAFFEKISRSADINKLAEFPNVMDLSGEIKRIARYMAEIDGFDVTLRSLEVDQVKTIEKAKHWVVPVRNWAQNDDWQSGDKKLKGSHDADGRVRPEYIQAMESEGIYDKKGNLIEDLLDPDCIEARDWNLSAGQYKPFDFTQLKSDKSVTELIDEMRHAEESILQGLDKLLVMVEGGE